MTEPTPPEPDDQEPSGDALRAFAHPLRLRMLSLLTGAVMSAAEVARELGATQANASYHLRRLEAAGLLEVVEEVQIRGGLARRYHHDPASGSRLRTRGTEDAVLVAEGLAGELRRRAADRDSASRGVTTDAELWVDPDVWAAARETVRAASAQLHRAAQPPRTPGTVRVSATVAMFLMHPHGGSPVVHGPPAGAGPAEGGRAAADAANESDVDVSEGDTAAGPSSEAPASGPAADPAYGSEIDLSDGDSPLDHA